MLVPKLRFKREDGSEYPTWKSGTIGDYYIFKNGLNKEKSAFGQGTPIINYTDVFKNRLLTSKIIKGRVTLNDKEIENHSAVYGDVFFTRTSETLDEVGFCGALIEHIQDCVFSGFLLRGRPKDDTSISPNFAGYYFMTKPIREEIISKSSITTRALTNGRNLSAVNVKIPCLEEQQKIADFLSTVDEVITQSEAEVQNLEQQKKAAMQKIFSQEVRFKREDGTDYPEWEEKELGDFCNIKTGKLNANAMKENGKYRFYTCASEVYYIDTYAFDTEALLISGNGANVGYVHYYKGKFNAYQRTYVLDDFSENILYVKAYLDFALKNRIDEEKHSGNVPYIVLNTLAKMIIVVPCLEEQQKIADFLSAYDEAISYAKQELDKWKELKKGLLQQMFV